ncbi:GtrA family protein [Paenibacillus rhizovicinus]|uniref:GtrA family protein n=1 Tax=Paenibacillus rhizovicinus TaxID=2704463 RepID=A0A6C0P7M5_9BACL|nr:GtrA family protein [Paenibacillus rhizovicinus]QHW33643.1 GtrA family protein [Paenibacillus rhizovicinus]
MTVRHALFRRPFVRFLFVGGLNTLIGLGVSYGLLHLASFSYWGATFAGNAFGAVNSYMLNRKFTFASQASVSRSFIKFVIVITICYFFAFDSGLWLARVAVPAFPHLSEAVVNDIAVVTSTVIYTLINYFGQKLVVFRETRKPHESEA